MANIAVLGYGTVGSGVVELINTNKSIVTKNAKEEINIKYILDLKDFPNEPIQKIITHNFDDILNDNSIDVVVEVLGGINPAYTFVKSALLKGKSVCTSNKELVATHGEELMNIAINNNINFLFEASVGGGIPIINPLHNSITADNILEIDGILNGTTNYMLTKMLDENLDYDDVLKAAQLKGYAEKDPSADVEGYDACRKIAILASIATGKKVDYNDVYTEGITYITKSDIDYIKSLDKTIKLIAKASFNDNTIWARVAPTIINKDNPLALVNNVFNAIKLKGDMLNDIMFYGKGAGKLPTASAVVSDIILAVKNKNNCITTAWASDKQELMPIDNVAVKKFVRIEYTNKEEALAYINQIFGNDVLIKDINIENELAFITAKANEIDINKNLDKLLNLNCIIGIPNTIRIED